MNTKKSPNIIGVNSRGRRTVFSLCGMCAVRCPIQVEVEDGRVVWIQGNANDKGIGTSLCAKGSAGLSLEYDDERPQYPLIRSGQRGAGHWRRASWDEALDYVANGLKEVMHQYGPKGVALSDRGGMFNDLTKSFVRALGSPNYFDHDCTCGRNAHHATRSLFGFGRTDIAYDIKNTKHIVLYGRNLIESLQVKEAKEFIEALSKGAKCTYIDPRGSLTATKASRFWQIRPGTDYALNLAIIHLVLQQDLYDHDFVSKWVNGLQELSEFVADKTPEWQEQYTGIPAREVRLLVREIAQDAPRIIFHAGWMTARYNQSFFTSRTAHILNVLFGAIEVPGGLILSKGPGDVGARGLNRLTDRIPPVEERRVDGCNWKFKHFDPGSGLLHLLFEAMNTGEPYPVGAYIAYRHDPLTSMPDPDAVKQAMDKLKLLVSVDVNYSEMSWFSDVILPESTYLERANILAEKKGPKPCFLMRDQAVAPRFDSRPAWWIFGELAKRLNIGQWFDFESIEEIWNYQLEGTGVTVAQVRDKGMYSLSDRPVLWDRDNELKFKTPSGKIEFVSTLLDEAGVPSLAQFAPPSEKSNQNFRLLFGRTAIQAHGQSMNNPLLSELLVDNPAWIHPDRAKGLGIEDGDAVEISNQGHMVTTRAMVTPWIHPEAVFMLHGFGRIVHLE